MGMENEQQFDDFDSNLDKFKGLQLINSLK